MLTISTLNRLISARHLLESGGPALTREVSSILLAQRVLQAHDASELISFALISHCNLTASEIDGKVRKEPSFMALVRAVLAACQHADDFVSLEKLFFDLNESRVAFKHHGRLPDPATNYSLPSDIEDALNKICQVLLGTSLAKIDLTEAISDSEAKAYLISAKHLIEVADYKTALEEIASALACVFWNIPGVSSTITVGVASTEDALLLSGRGIDPPSFLIMQRLLPMGHFPGAVSWDSRAFGHAANWTKPNADYCLSTAIRITISLQNSQGLATVLHFHDVYEDTLTIKKSGCEAIIVRASERLPRTTEDFLTRLEAGDVICCQASGHLTRKAELNPKHEVDFEDAEWIAATRPKCAKIMDNQQKGYDHVIWLRRSDVEISFRTRGS